MQTRSILEIYEGITYFSFGVHKLFSLYNPITFLAILHPNSLAKVVVEAGTRYRH